MLCLSNRFLVITIGGRRVCALVKCIIRWLLTGRWVQGSPTLTDSELFNLCWFTDLSRYFLNKNKLNSAYGNGFVDDVGDCDDNSNGNGNNNDTLNSQENGKCKGNDNDSDHGVDDGGKSNDNGKSNDKDDDDDDNNDDDDDDDDDDQDHDDNGKGRV